VVEAEGDDDDDDDDDELNELGSEVADEKAEDERGLPSRDAAAESREPVRRGEAVGNGELSGLRGEVRRYPGDI
jgi:hypothetical protein